MGYDELLDYCKTDRQREIVQACIKHGSQKNAAKALGASKRHIERTVQMIKINATMQGAGLVGTLNKPYNEPQVLKGTSTLYDAKTGEAKISWVKTDVDKSLALKMLIEGSVAAMEDVKPLPVVRAPRRTNKDLLAVYPMGDPHIGMYSWSDETGEDFDCDIAERNLREAMMYLVDKTPPAETAVILNLGDFFHSDNQSNRTARAGNALDVDTRWSRVLQIGIQLMIDCVNLALEKHKRVIVKNNIGNHDDHTSQVLSICLSHAFKNNKRVEIANPADSFFAFEFGKVSLFSTHGHMVKPAKLQGVISNYYPEIWGATSWRHCFIGHFHHSEVLEDNGLTVEIFNTLAGTDNWHHSSGYRSQRNMKAVVFDRNEGEVERYTFNISPKRIGGHSYN